MQGDGWTRDINQVGAFIYSTHCPPAGTLTNLQVILPPLGKEGRVLKVYMNGHVLRVEANDSKQEATGFAVLSVHITLRTTSEDGSEEIIEDSEFDSPES